MLSVKLRDNHDYPLYPPLISRARRSGGRVSGLFAPFKQDREGRPGKWSVKNPGGVGSSRRACREVSPVLGESLPGGLVAGGFGDPLPVAAQRR